MTRNIDEQRAKQGRSGRQVLTILIVALVLMAIGWYFVELYGRNINPEPSKPVETAPSQSSAQPAAPAGGTNGATATGTSGSGGATGSGAAPAQ